MASLDYDTYTYLAITLTPSSTVLADPSRVHPHLKHLGPVGQLFLPHLIRSRSCNAGGGRSTARHPCVLSAKANVGALIRSHHPATASRRWYSKG
jgi:hypothetical protein